MAQLSTLIPLVIERCPNIIQQQALDYLKKAYRKFCLESGFVQYIEQVQRESNSSVTLNPPLNHYISHVQYIKSERDIKIERGLDYKVDAENNIKLDETFSQVSVAYAVAPMLPMANDFDANATIIRNWPEHLASGAASLLRKMPGQAWTNLELSNFYEREFIEGHREAYRSRISADDEAQTEQQSTRTFY